MANEQTKNITNRDTNTYTHAPSNATELSEKIEYLAMFQG